MRQLLLPLLLVSMPALAAEDTWLCVGELMAFVSNDDDSVVHADAIESDRKFLVSTDGVKDLGRDMPFLDSCSSNDLGRVTYCEFAEEGHTGFFRMNENNVFTLVFFTEVDDKQNDIVVKGKCSKL